MKRYLVFFIAEYYPSGGMDDFWEDFEDLSEAVSKTKERVEGQINADCMGDRDYWNEYRKAVIFDQHEKKEVWSTRTH